MEAFSIRAKSFPLHKNKETAGLSQKEKQGETL